MRRHGRFAGGGGPARQTEAGGAFPRPAQPTRLLESMPCPAPRKTPCGGNSARVFPDGIHQCERVFPGRQSVLPA
jgi:hypothetical protein